MKILIPTIGTRGDLQPYIALSLGLQAAGLTPTIASHPFTRNLVESYGIPFAPIGPDIDIGRETAIIRGKSPNWVLGLMRVMKFSLFHAGTGTSRLASARPQHRPRYCLAHFCWKH